MKTLTKLETLIDLFPNQLWLEFNDIDKQKLAKQEGRAFLNSLATDIISNWLVEEEELPAKVIKDQTIWQFINGTIITVENTRILLLPTDQEYIEELVVAQEWVDIGQWVADYYLGVQVNLEENWLRVYGYCTHQQLKTLGSYDSVAKLYYLDKDELIEDIGVMLVARHYGQERAVVSQIQTLTRREVEVTMAKVTNDEYARLLLPFEEWARVVVSQGNKEQITREKAVRISDWLTGIFEAGWTVADQMWAGQTFAFATRNSQENIIKATKLLDLGIELGEQSLVLLMACVPNPPDKISVIIQVHPAQGTKFLPPNLRLAVMDEDGNLIQQPITSRTMDNYMQLKRFSAPVGVPFTLELTLNGVTLKENFVL